ncbi:MAG: response regulator [Chitinophagaceae bacterium]|nr:response regulator [Chitinophagaceae bacterium]
MKSILLIEDNIDILENLAEYLEMEGYQVYSTNNGEKGIELALKFMPDLIICDMPRPGIDGYKVLKTLIDNLSITKIPFIFCTTMSEKINRSDALESGADDYITKPFELENILQIAKLCIKTGTKRQRLTA